MKVIYVGPFLSTAPGSAALQRALGISRSLLDAGGSVVIGTGDEVDTPVPAELSIPGIQINHVRRRSQHAGKLARARNWWAFAGDVVAWLDRSAVPDALILYGGGAHLSEKVQKWAGARKVPLVTDLVEWYDPRHQPLGRFGPFALDLERGMRSTYARAGNCIAISSLLEKHFNKQGCRTVRVPPTTDVLAIPWSEHRPGNNDLRFVYAGSPGRKDFLRTVIEGMELADPTGTRLSIDVFGPDLSALSELLDRPSVPSFVRPHGRVSREVVLDAVAAADYVPLIRPNERFANAGFPTKVVESLSAGTPVICNPTSDLRLHVRDGETGWLVPKPTAHAFAAAVRRALETPEHLATTRRQARAEAERSFDYRRHTSALSDFFDDLRLLA